MDDDGVKWILHLVRDSGVDELQDLILEGHEFPQKYGTSNVNQLNDYGGLPYHHDGIYLELIKLGLFVNFSSIDYIYHLVSVHFWVQISRYYFVLQLFWLLLNQIFYRNFHRLRRYLIFFN